MIPLSQEGALRMLKVPRLLHHLVQLTCMVLRLLVDAAHFLRLCLRCPAALAAENLFLRKQLALYQERQVTPGHATAYHGCYPPRPALARALVRLASGAGGGATRDVSPLASAGIPPVLAVEVPIRTPTDPCGPASPHPS